MELQSHGGSADAADAALPDAVGGDAPDSSGDGASVVDTGIADGVDTAPDADAGDDPRSYACGPLLRDSVAFLRAMIDRWTGLPYDQLPCGGPWASGTTGINRAWGVVPQLASAQIGTFSEDQSKVAQTVDWSFVDRGPDGADPDLLYALKIELHLTAPGDAAPSNTFGGLTWGADVDASRYWAVRIRYSTSGPTDGWDLKLNSGSSPPHEPAVALAGTPAGSWSEARFTLDQFSGSDLRHLNYLTLAAAQHAGVPVPTLWVDQISFEADPSQVGSCSVSCPDPLPAGSDLACYDPMTGAVNVANELSAFSVAPSMGLVDAAVAEAIVERAMTTLETLPGAAATARADGSPWAGGGWPQDWHSPVSGMPDPHNRVASITDEPQLYAALMVVERTWPDLAVRAAALRARMDFAVLYDGSKGCPGVLYGAIDRCSGVRRDWLAEFYGNDGVLGPVVALGSGAVPGCFWSGGLATKGCALDGPADKPWLRTGGACADAAIPASDTGGPFVQLAPLTYLQGDRVPVGRETLSASARDMLAAQLDFAASAGLPLAGWANASDPDACTYMTCEKFTPSKVTPYISAMGLDLLPTSAAKNLFAFHAAGADAPLRTGSVQHAFGLRDAWDQTAGARDAYLYLDSGWTALGLMNACAGGILRERFAGHAIATAAYAAIQSHPAACGSN